MKRVQCQRNLTPNGEIWAMLFVCIGGMEASRFLFFRACVCPYFQGYWQMSTMCMSWNLLCGSGGLRRGMPTQVQLSASFPSRLKSTEVRAKADAAAAKSLQLCPTLCNPIDGSPPGSPVPGILQAGTLEWVATSFSNAWKWKVKVKLLSRVRLLATPWTAAYQAPLSMGFSRREYWSGLPLRSLRAKATTPLLRAACRVEGLR